MHQTLYALLALSILSLFSFNQRRALLQSYASMIDDEMEVMASGVALQVMEYIGSKDFDDATKNSNRIDSAALLSSEGSFGVSTRCDVVAPIEETGSYQVCDDLDDFHKMKLERVPFFMEQDTVFFDVTSLISYVDNSGKDTASRSFNKKVEVIVQSPDSTTFLREPVHLIRTFTYEKMKGSK